MIRVSEVGGRSDSCRASCKPAKQRVDEGCM